MDYPKIDKPTEPGWYWYRCPPAKINWVVRRVYEEGGALWVLIPNMDHILLEELPGEWHGPIPRPSP